MCCMYHRTIFTVIYSIPVNKFYTVLLLSCHAFAWARLGTLVVILSFCLLPWKSSLSAHNFHGAFSRATKLAYLSNVVFYCSVVFWKKRTEQKANNIPKHKKTKQLSVRYFQQRLKLFYKENKI